MHSSDNPTTPPPVRKMPPVPPPRRRLPSMSQESAPPLISPGTEKLVITNKQKCKRTGSGIKKQVQQGYIAKQRARGQKPNAKKFFATISFSALKSGLHLSPEAIKAVKQITKAHLQTERSSQLLSSSSISVLKKLKLQIKHFLTEQEELQKILTVQSAIRRWIVHKRYISLSEKKEKQRVLNRNACFLELLRSEKHFLNTIYDVISKFVLPLRNSDIIEPQEGAYLFGNIETVAREHKALCSQLLKAQSDWPFLGNVGKIFLDIKQLLNATSAYVAQYKCAVNEIERIKSEKPRFQAFVEQQEAKSEFNLPTLLMLPVDRISQYEEYLQKILEYIIPGTQEYEDYENATAALAQSNLSVQASYVEAGHVARILKVQQKLKSAKGPLTVMKTGRQFIREFLFKKYYVCMFSDVILIASKATKAKEPHKYLEMLPIHKTEIKIEKTIELSCPPHLFRLSPVTEEDKNDFISLFNIIISEFNRTKVFGAPLIETIDREARPNGIPFVVEFLTQYIRKNGMNVPGIFRAGGEDSQTKKIAEVFDTSKQEEKALTELLDQSSIFSVCSALKLYFRSLPEPLLGYALYDPIVELMRDSDELEDSKKIQKIKTALENCTFTETQVVLKYLITFLHEVASNCATNKMTTNNLAIVFGPTMLWCEENLLESAMDIPYVTGAVKLIIENHLLLP